LKEAAQPYIWEQKGIRVGIYACAEHEFLIATEYSPGATPFDPLESLDHIQDLANKCDYLIVLYHGGKEHYRLMIYLYIIFLLMYVYIIYSSL
jgi:hypothetical protein